MRFFACAARPEPSESITSFLAPCGILEGYDLIVHVGVGARGGLSLEKRGRKEGYLIPDYEGKLAPVLGPYEKAGKYALGDQVLLSDAIRHEIERASGGSSGSEPDDPENAFRRGFGEGYEEFPDEIWNSLDCDQIVAHLKKTGFEVRQLLRSILAHSPLFCAT